jgi:hypothetical protein
MNKNEIMIAQALLEQADKNAQRIVDEKGPWGLFLADEQVIFVTLQQVKSFCRPYRKSSNIWGVMLGAISTLILIVSILFALNLAYGQEKVYDKNWNTRIYVTEDGQVFDKNWNRKGHIKDSRIYDKNWNPKGYKDGKRKGKAGGRK